MKAVMYKMLRDDDGKNSLVKESSCYVPSVDSVNNETNVETLLNCLFSADKLAEEHMWMLAVNTKMKVIGIFEVAHGQVNGCMISPREIFIRALMIGATYILLAHNHPSGIPTPSQEDERITQRVAEAGKLIGIPLIDHVIIGDGRTYSFYGNDNKALARAK